ncbi:hypothetical protein [Caballeronia arationis]|jgi:hypothetical protein|uniref:hypothetical protein n=1 Tax=Caballeronia arationis TaxID=1777142 RepID=UPI000B351A78|nr:hypothetical protein [Caballeronia arationis]
MTEKIGLATLALAVGAISTVASAHVDVGIGLVAPAPLYYPAQPVYPPPPMVYAPPPPPVVYGPQPALVYGDDDWRQREWREHREWRKRQWRHHEERAREHAWHERDGRGDD